MTRMKKNTRKLNQMGLLGAAGQQQQQAGPAGVRGLLAKVLVSSGGHTGRIMSLLMHHQRRSDAVDDSDHNCHLMQPSHRSG
jgi:hypothetical protein